MSFLHTAVMTITLFSFRRVESGITWRNWQDVFHWIQNWRTCFAVLWGHEEHTQRGNIKHTYTVLFHPVCMLLYTKQFSTCPGGQVLSHCRMCVALAHIMPCRNSSRLFYKGPDECDAAKCFTLAFSSQPRCCLMFHSPSDDTFALWTCAEGQHKLDGTQRGGK